MFTGREHYAKRTSKNKTIVRKIAHLVGSYYLQPPDTRAIFV